MSGGPDVTKGCLECVLTCKSYVGVWIVSWTWASSHSPTHLHRQSELMWHLPRPEEVASTMLPWLNNKTSENTTSKQVSNSAFSCILSAYEHPKISKVQYMNYFQLWHMELNSCAQPWGTGSWFHRASIQDSAIWCKNHANFLSIWHWYWVKRKFRTQEASPPENFGNLHEK